MNDHWLIIDFWTCLWNIRWAYNYTVLVNFPADNYTPIKMENSSQMSMHRYKDIVQKIIIWYKKKHNLYNLRLWKVYNSHSASLFFYFIYASALTGREARPSAAMTRHTGSSWLCPPWASWVQCVVLRQTGWVSAVRPEARSICAVRSHGVEL